MLTEAEQAHAEGAKNLYRYNRTDIINVCVWVGFFVVVVGAGWLITHLISLGAHPPAYVCSSVAECNRYILSHPLKHVPNPDHLPAYQPVPGAGGSGITGPG